MSAIDRKMAMVYAEDSQKVVNEHPPVLKPEQRGWVKGRNDCWKSEDKRKCVEESYRLRIDELQARYRLVPAKGPTTYICNGDPRNEVVVSFFQTEPTTLIAERGDQVSLMYLQPAASGSKYQGRNESLWETMVRPRLFGDMVVQRFAARFSQPIQRNRRLILPKIFHTSINLNENGGVP